MKVGYIALLAALGVSPVFAAEMHHMDHGAMHSSQSAAAVEASGKLNGIDAANGTVNIAHDPIAALGWPAMTMDFRLEQNSLAAKLKPGQRVNFKLKKVGETDYVISAIEAAK